MGVVPDRAASKSIPVTNHITGRQESMKSRIAWVELATVVLVLSIAPTFVAAETLLKGRRPLSSPQERVRKQAAARV